MIPLRNVGVQEVADVVDLDVSGRVGGEDFGVEGVVIRATGVRIA
jgi:hypothetical protein